MVFPRRDIQRASRRYRDLARRLLAKSVTRLPRVREARR